jgi:hypothetical protein
MSPGSNSRPVRVRFVVGKDTCGRTDYSDFPITRSFYLKLEKRIRAGRRAPFWSVFVQLLVTAPHHELNCSARRRTERRSKRKDARKNAGGHITREHHVTKRVKKVKTKSKGLYAL